MIAEEKMQEESHKRTSGNINEQIPGGISEQILGWFFVGNPGEKKKKKKESRKIFSWKSLKNPGEILEGTLNKSRTEHLIECRKLTQKILK